MFAYGTQTNRIHPVQRSRAYLDTMPAHSTSDDAIYLMHFAHTAMSFIIPNINHTCVCVYSHTHTRHTSVKHTLDLHDNTSSTHTIHSYTRNIRIIRTHIRAHSTTHTHARTSLRLLYAHTHKHMISESVPINAVIATRMLHIYESTRRSRHED